MLRALCLAFAAAAVLTVSAHAETYRLQYSAVVLGVVELGQASYTVTSAPTRYDARATIRTSGLARLFDQTDINATAAGAIGGVNVTWSRYDLTHAYAQKSRRIQLVRAGNGVTAQITPGYGNMGRPPASMAQQAGSFDPLSAVFALGRQIGAARACTGSVLVFDGRGHYRLSVAPRSQGTFTGPGYTGPMVACTMRYQPIAGFTLSAEERARIPEALAIFAMPAQPGFAPPLRLTVPTPLGDAQLDLRGFERTN